MTWKEILEVMKKDKRVRLSIVKKLHKLFFCFYFSHYIEFEMAPLHEEMFRITQDAGVRNAVIVGFRGCGKSTIFTTSFPLWAILGEQKIKFVLILSQTQQKAQALLQEIKYELETNEMIKNDLGPFQEERNQWNITSLYLTRYDAKITAASAEQSIRGIRHKQHRPQLIIADDLEDLESVKTIEGRNKVYNWLVGDVLPAGDKQTRLIIVGSLLHEDSLIKRLQKGIDGKTMNGIFREFPLLDEKGNSTWPGKFPDQKAIEEEKAKGISDSAWQREYLLKVVPQEGSPIMPDWIRFYRSFPPHEHYVGTFTAADLAISQSDRADFTAMVSACAYNCDDKPHIFILPDPVNERLDFPQQIERAKLISKTLGNSPIIIEDVGYQKALIQILDREGLSVEGYRPESQNKRTRLSLTSDLMKNGQIFFPEKGAEELIQQIKGLGAERHDDLADAFAMLVLHIRKNVGPAPRIIWL